MVSCPSSVFRYLANFRQEEEGSRRSGKAFIPPAPKNLVGLSQVNGDLLAFAQQHALTSSATHDLDATLVETTKRETLF
ncbi:MAG: hypothetical protein ACUVRZ_00350 [Desulfobacca sp.]|uniref:hypothetical protein n=1 Tax=Desulfobacca sp. TaxID=2067990 RepID=UPI00404909E3